MIYIKKPIIGTILIIMISIQTFTNANSDYNDFELHTNNLKDHHWHAGMNPGMAFNLNGNDIKIFRE